MHVAFLLRVKKDSLLCHRQGYSKSGGHQAGTAGGCPDDSWTDKSHSDEMVGRRTAGKEEGTERPKPGDSVPCLESFASP